MAFLGHQAKMPPQDASLSFVSMMALRILGGRRDEKGVAEQAAMGEVELDCEIGSKGPRQLGSGGSMFRRDGREGRDRKRRSRSADPDGHDAGVVPFSGRTAQLLQHA